MFIFSKLFNLFTGVGQKPRKIKQSFNSDDEDNLPPNEVSLEEIFHHQQKINRYIQNDINRINLENQEEFQRQMIQEQEEQQQEQQEQNDIRFTNMNTEQSINDSIQSMNNMNNML